MDLDTMKDEFLQQLPLVILYPFLSIKSCFHHKPSHNSQNSGMSENQGNNVITLKSFANPMFEYCHGIVEYQVHNLVLESPETWGPLQMFPEQKFCSVITMSSDAFHEKYLINNIIYFHQMHFKNICFISIFECDSKPSWFVFSLSPS